MKHICEGGNSGHIPRAQIIVKVRITKCFLHVGNRRRVPTRQFGVHGLCVRKCLVQSSSLAHIPWLQSSANKFSGIFKGVPEISNFRSLPLQVKNIQGGKEEKKTRGPEDQRNRGTEEKNTRGKEREKIFEKKINKKISIPSFLKPYGVQFF